MKIKEISSSILEKLSSFEISDDSLYEESYIWYLMDVYRAVLLNERNGIGIDAYFQMTCCIEIACDRIRCSGYDSGDSIFYAKIPELIEYPGNINYFGTTSFAKRKGIDNRIDIVSMEQFLTSDYARYTDHLPIGTILNGYKDGDTKEGQIILLKNMPTDGFKKACLSAIFARPINELCEEDVNDFNYPFPDVLIGRLELLVVKDILDSSSATIGDPINDMAAIKSRMVSDQTEQMPAGGTDE